METQEVKALIEKYKAGRATEAEQLLLETWYAKESLLQMQQPELEDYARIKAEIWNNLDAQLPAVKGVKLRPRIAVVAAAVAAIVFGVWFYNTSYMNGRELGGRHPELVSGPQDIAPGKNTATITLPNGSIIQLSDAKTGVVVGNELTYNDGTAVDKQLSPSGGDAAGRGGSNSSNPLFPQGGSLPEGERNSMMLTASTPRGGTYQFTLPDGTQVWLNAASKISFPAQFSGQTRKILLSGEAYFEVAKDEKHPFIVKTGSQETEVLGTHFNINDYGHPYVRTTLLEGSIRVKNYSIPGRADEVVLKPNQEAVIHELALSVRAVKASDAAAWKDGKFRFDNIYLEEVMAQLSRWYDVEVRYPDGLPMIKLSGGIDRRVTLAVALDILKDLNVKFKVEGKVISIYK